MARCRFVQPEVVRLYLVDVHRRALETLKASPLPTLQSDAKKTLAVLQSELEQALSERQEALDELQATIDEAVKDGHYVDVKKQLNAGEAHRVFTRQLRPQGIGESSLVDLDSVYTSKLVAYIVGWSLTDPQDKPVPFSEAALDNLDEVTFLEIRAAVEHHDESVEAARTHRKNNQGGGNESSAALPSVSSTEAGAMSGSTP